MGFRNKTNTKSLTKHQFHGEALTPQTCDSSSCQSVEKYVQAYLVEQASSRENWLNPLSYINVNY